MSIVDLLSENYQSLAKQVESTLAQRDRSARVVLA